MKTMVEKINKNAMAKIMASKLDNPDDKWGSEIRQLIFNTEKHLRMCELNKTILYAPNSSVKRAYINEIWLCEIPPPDGTDTMELLGYHRMERTQWSFLAAL
jgi:hypothetical protein